MKNKYLLFCMTLSIVFVLGGCNKNEITQEDIIYNLDLHSDVHADESSDKSESKSETNL